MNTISRIGLVFLVLAQLSLSGSAQPGVISTVAGNGTEGFGGDGGPAILAALNKPVGVAVDLAGNLYIAEEYGRVRKVTSDGVISTVAGNGSTGFSGDGGPAISAQLANPAGIDVDSAGNLYIADFNNRRIRKVTPEGMISTVAGGGVGGDGGPATSAGLLGTIDVAVDRTGNFYFSESAGWDSDHDSVRKVTSEGVISTVVGQETQIPGDGGPFQLYLVGSLAADFAGNLYIADSKRVYKVSADGTVRAVATSTQLPSGIALDWAGNLYISEIGNNRVRKVTPDGVISTVAGSGKPGFSGDGGPATSAQLDGPTAIAVDSMGNLYILDSGNYRIRKVETTQTPQAEEFFVPIVLSAGGMNGSFYTSELTLTNRATSHATINFTYTAALGSGSATAIDTLAPGEQKIVPDAISYLRSLGVPIPSSADQGGTLRVRFSGLTSPAGGVTVRTTTEVREGHAGLAYAGIPISMALTEPSYICGLRQNQRDRSNVAVQNVGTAEEGNITLRLTVFPGAGGTGTPTVLPDQVLAPGGFVQFNGILSYGPLLGNGYVEVERVGGTAPYYAYGVINDQSNSDGSFILPVAEGANVGKNRMMLPVVVENSAFGTELVVTNWSTTRKTLNCRFVSDNVSLPDATASFSIDVDPLQQLIWPELIEKLRQSQIAGIGDKGTSYVGALLISASSGDLSEISVGARTSSPGGEGRYGIYYTALPEDTTTANTAWLYGLQQNGENRTNLALINRGESDGSVDTFRIDLFNGDTGFKVATLDDINVEAHRWLQIDMILSRYAPGVTHGYAKVTRTAGNNPFIAYAVINDGCRPGERTGDGAFIASSP